MIGAEVAAFSRSPENCREHWTQRELFPETFLPQGFPAGVRVPGAVFHLGHAGNGSDGTRHAGVAIRRRQRPAQSGANRSPSGISCAGLTATHRKALFVSLYQHDVLTMDQCSAAFRANPEWKAA
jgi:hypothetical protein